MKKILVLFFCGFSASENFRSQDISFIEYHNNRGTGYTLDINPSIGLSHNEFLTKYTGLIPTYNTRPDNTIPKNIIPSSVDWRSNGVVNPIRDQAMCGSCWAFATISTIESAYKLRYNQSISLSEQQLVNCVKYGCKGGMIERAYIYFRKNGICSSIQCPYTATQGICKSCKSSSIKIKSYINVRALEINIASAVSKQPVVVGIDASSKQFRYYKSGIFVGPCNRNVNHAVVIVGYGSENGTMYWIVRNSWGVEWGESGYIRMKRGLNLCGINDMVSYPIF